MADDGLRCVCGKKLGSYAIGVYRTTCRGCGADVVFSRAGRATIRDQFGRVVRVAVDIALSEPDAEPAVGTESTKE